MTNTVKSDDRHFYNPTAVLMSPDYDPASFLDALEKRFGIKNDAAMALTLGLKAPQISKVRHKRLPVTHMFLMRVHEAFDLPVRELRTMLGD